MAGLGHGMNMKKRKLFITDTHHPICTLCSLQTKVVLPKAKEAYNLGPDSALKDLAMSLHYHIFAKLENKIRYVNHNRP